MGLNLFEVPRGDPQTQLLPALIDYITGLSVHDILLIRPLKELISAMKWSPEELQFIIPGVESWSSKCYRKQVKLIIRLNNYSQ